MLKLTHRKATVLIGTSAAVVALAGAAYAYYAGGIAGSGSGTAATADSTISDLTFEASAITGLVPGTSQTTTITLTNGNAFAVGYPATTFSVGSVSGPTGCDTNAVALLSGSANKVAGVLASGASTTVDVVVSMADSLTEDQSACNDASFDVTYSASPTP